MAHRTTTSAVSPLTLRPMVLALAMALGHAGSALAADADAEPAMQVVTITGAADDSSYTVRRSDSASKLDLSLRETPQSVSVITRAMMDDFKLDNAGAVLARATGVTIEQVETDRSYYTARGFDIVNFLYDGTGLPLVFGLTVGDMDTAIYDRVDIVRGANGLMTSTGNPSATVNFIRKRPTRNTQASASVTLGSWNKRRVEGDVSTALNDSGSVTARVVAVREEKDSYLDRYAPKKTVLHAVVEARLDAATVLTAGHSFQDNDGKGTMWGALPLFYTDGSPTTYPRSTSTSADWSQWNTRTHSTFAELEHRFDSGWSTKATATYNTSGADSKLFYVYGTPDKATGGGLFAYPSIYNSDNKQTLVDLSASGKFTLAGREHDLSLGLNWSRSTLHDVSLYGRGIGTELTYQTAFGGAFPEPAFDASTDGSQYEDKRRSAYLATRLNLADNTKLLAGINSTKADSSGVAYGESQYKSASKSTPYLGLVVDLGRDVSAYASHTRIFNPQNQVDINGHTLDPVVGKSSELGVKAELFNNKLNLSGAVFKVQQDNAAEQAGYVGAKAYYQGISAESKGYELETSGELARNWQASAGLTRMSISGNEGQDIKTYLPRTTLRTATTYRLPATPVTVGANLNWQSDIRYNQGGGISTRQSSYAVLGLMARYQIDKHLSLALNLNNVTDKRYLTSLYWSQGYYAAPRNASATLAWAL